MSSSASASGSAILGGGSSIASSGGGNAGVPAAAPVAPIIEPPASFGVVAPGIYRCSASSLTKSLPASSTNRQASKAKTLGPTPASALTSNGYLASSSASSYNNSNSNSNNGAATINLTNTTATPTESFLSSLQLKTILLFAPEKRPPPLHSWCENNNVQLIHLGLGALTNVVDLTVERGDSEARGEKGYSPISTQPSLETYSSFPDSGILSLERTVKDSLEILLHQSRLPCLICDTSGVNETGVVVGCLRRMQRRNFASIRYEVSQRAVSSVQSDGSTLLTLARYIQYHAFAGSRSRSSHERFIEVNKGNGLERPSLSSFSLT
jgi:hypothetical protein